MIRICKWRNSLYDQQLEPIVKILFVQKDVFMKPAIMLLSAILKNKGYSCELFVQDLENKLEEKISSSGANLVAFSISTGEYSWMSNLSSHIRPFFKGPIICGGPHPTFYPEMINDEHIDAICMGEGDEALPEFVKAIETGGDITAIPNFITKLNGKIFRNRLRPLIEDLDSLPYFDRSLYHKYPLYRGRLRELLFYNMVITGRGCPYGCTFCFNRLYNQLYHGMGTVYRRRSIQNVINEIMEMRQNDPLLTLISFDDDIFNLPPGEWIEGFLEEYRNSVGVPFKINSRADLLDDDLIRRLKESGCYTIKIGVESGNQHIRNVIYQKNISDSEIINAASAVKRNGMKLQTYNIFGAPGETLEKAFETFDINRVIRPDFAWCSLLNPYPGTDIYNYCIDNNYLKKNFNFTDIGYSYFNTSPLRLKNMKEIINLQRLTNFAIMTHLPKSIINILIRLPLQRFYKFLYGVGFAVSMKRLNKTSWLNIIKLSFMQLFKYNL